MKDIHDIPPRMNWITLLKLRVRNRRETTLSSYCEGLAKLESSLGVEKATQDSTVRPVTRTYVRKD